MYNLNFRVIIGIFLTDFKFEIMDKIKNTKQLYVSPKMEVVLVDLEYCIAASSVRVAPGGATDDHPLITMEEVELKQGDWNL